MRKTVTAMLGALTACVFVNPAAADLIFAGQQDLGALGFGNFPRLITMHEPTSAPGIETGTVAPGPGGTVVDTGDAIANGPGGQNKSNTPTIGSLGWLTGSMVDLAFDVSQTGGTGLTLQTMGITLYNGLTPVGTFQLPSPFNITPAQAGMDQGNGNGVLVFTLNLAERNQFNALVLADGTGLTVGSFGSWGCATTPSPTCQPANDGQDSLVAVPSVSAVPGPLAGAGIPGLIAGCLGMVALARRRFTRWRGMGVA